MSRYILFAVSFLAISGLCFIATACTEGGLAEPISLPPVLPTVTPLPTASPLLPATELPVPTPAALATDLPTTTPLPTATELPTPTPLPAVREMPAATELPTAEPAPPATVLPFATPTPHLSQPLVTIGSATWLVELAVEPEERNRGLSGWESLPESAGMLFVFEGDQHLSFWMVDMNFPLDMVWIDSSCRVVDVTLDAPTPLPDQSRAELPRFRPSSPARFVLEINAGEFNGAQLEVGDVVKFEEALAGQYGC